MVLEFYQKEKTLIDSLLFLSENNHKKDTKLIEHMTEHGFYLRERSNPFSFIDLRVF